MFPLRTSLIPLLLAALLLTAGCTSLYENPGANATVPDQDRSASRYQVTISQPVSTADLIRMDSDVYNAGEVVEFSVVNDNAGPLTCTNTPPGFVVRFQTGSGRWATKMGPEVPVTGNKSTLEKGASTQVYRFITTGWEPGRYRIVSDCGVEREILIRGAPTPVPTPTACPVTNATNATTPSIHIDPVGNQEAGRPFTIHGTTDLPAGTELRYVIFTVLENDQAAYATDEYFVTIVQEGTCGTNTWSARGEILDTGDFFIRIGDPAAKASAIRRFTVTSP